MFPVSKSSALFAACLTTVALGVVSGAPATAQTPARGFALDQFEPLPAPGLNLLNVSTSRMLGNLQLSASVFVHYADDPLTVVRTNPAQTLVERPLDDVTTADVAVAVGILRYVSLGVVVPAALSQSGGDLQAIGRPGESVGSTAIGDVRVVTKIRFWDPADAYGFGLHLNVPVALPTGDIEAFQSDGTVRVRPTLGLDYHASNGLIVAANVGYDIRERQTVHNLVRGQAVRWGVAVEIPTSLTALSVVGSIFGSVSLEDNLNPVDLGEPSAESDNPTELLGALRIRLGTDFALLAGGGAGIGHQVGAPDFRLFGAFGYTPMVDAHDSDGDGIPDSDDRCPDRAEDLDGHEDLDGCPDPDNDGDGIPDGADRCPDEAEDKDGFEDFDGCPDLDNDGDGVPDAVDKCPDVPEDKDGYEDHDGCPDDDNDGDGISDAVDVCPHEAEDMDGYQDGDGCIDPDNDKDGIYDVNDDCPDFPETFNGIDDADGCPDTPHTDVQIDRDAIKILRQIHFTRNDTKVHEQSRATVRHVAEVILSNAQITLIRIEGHTDNLGSPDKNRRVSQARADAVMAYLIRQGVNPEILIAKGMGATQPVADDRTPVGRAQNRRVTFQILSIDGKRIPDSK